MRILKTKNGELLAVSDHVCGAQVVAVVKKIKKMCNRPHCNCCQPIFNPYDTKTTKELVDYESDL